ncbi:MULTISPECIES: N-acetylmuramoyl-L-alanine amidase [unclassified Streptomyces]|uniref:N-acetylmuramoyl-L-alanine amidase n=1 Tax=unclassified Streptomyces TaxID=2593676 RepID=UPI0022543269|nr:MULTISPECIES: N-acetylmuramoyl-L-alanine amidase [unclassified Streptomyces]MCX4647006.1 N-acetylmuramoyl-L-alanine amidase [Streptomyces sp. NBC_01446]MCX5326969.1 N-acetylmuramoyl-L-alanine amidase [Streptomyces sp. NBC_00120]
MTTAAVTAGDPPGGALSGVERDNRPGAVDAASAQWLAASPANYRVADRPDDYRVDRIVVHVTQSRFADAVHAFRDPAHQAAAHYVVRASDGHIAQTVREADVAYHAGNREWNERSVGVEHEGYVDDPQRWFTDAAYEASAELVAGIAERHGIPVDREHIVGHSEVPGATHTDPGRYWDWDRYLRLVRDAHERLTA